MFSRSRRARLVNLTWYSMSTSKSSQGLVCWNDATGGDILEALANSLFHISTCGEVEKTLIGGGILDDCLCSSVYGQYERAFCLLQTPEELSRFASEGRYGVNIFGNVEHALRWFHSTFNGATVGRFLQSALFHSFFAFSFA